MFRLLLDVSEVAGFVLVEEQVENRSNERIDSECDDSQNEVQEGPRLESVGLQTSVVDDETADESQEERQKKTYEISCHINSSFFGFPCGFI